MSSKNMRATAAAAVALGLAALAGGCGASNSSRNAGRVSITAQFLAYARCIRAHGVSDFPDPTTPPGGGAAFSIQGGPGSDLNRSNPTFTAARQACRTLLPGGQQTQTLSAPHIAAEVRWARCMRSHGLPDFPDPNSQGAFDSSRFNETSPAFNTASTACASQRPTGPTPVVPGRG
jgi:hypothetical protein